MVKKKMIFKSIKNRELISQLIVADIENLIRLKKFPENGKLPSEREFCEKFNVSRNVLREALKVLIGMGLINIQKGKGIFVNDFSSDFLSNHIERYLMLGFDKDRVLDMYEVREAIEPNIVASAALNRTDLEIEKLKENMEKFCDQEVDFNERSLLDGQFHSLIAKASKNSYFPLIMEPIYNIMHEIRKTVYPAVKESGHSAEQWHKKILDAIINKDPEKAKRYIINHLKISKEHTKKWIRTQVE